MTQSKHTHNKVPSIKIYVNKTSIVVPDPCFQSLEPLYNLMMDMTHVRIGNKFNRQITLFPNTIYLEFGRFFNKPLGLLNKNLITLVTGDDFNQVLDLGLGQLPVKIKRITLGHDYNKPILFSKNITHLSFGNDFNQYIRFPKRTKHFRTKDNFNTPIWLTKNLTIMTVGNDFNQRIKLPKGIVHLSLGIYNKHIMLNCRIRYLEIDARTLLNYASVEHLSHELHLRNFFANRQAPILHELPNGLKQVYMDFSSGPIPSHNLPNTCLRKCEYRDKHIVGISCTY